ncbi:hypothetical protein Zm00014a_038600 [Zea mays]|uniref:Uncharacterized protein n=1 Tax=Zea mays TaxID=4577 RepID=A0A3L6EDA4_MAIZE|nr:hypothetical protein Zm00014a_038600 [Zea mays]
MGDAVEELGRKKIKQSRRLEERRLGKKQLRCWGPEAAERGIRASARECGKQYAASWDQAPAMGAWPGAASESSNQEPSTGR